MPINSISELRDSITERKRFSQEYEERMVHKVPDLPIVKNRMAYLIEKSKDKIVLDIGCTGLISKAIRDSAKKYYGLDREEGEWEICDIDHRPDLMSVHEDVEIIIVSEVLEHLANPGYFLLALKEKYPNKTVYITVPNAGAFQMYEDCELVNRDHVSWYSYTTLKTLLTRYDYKIKEARWYNGQPYKAEGLIAVVE